MREYAKHCGLGRRIFEEVKGLALAIFGQQEISIESTGLRLSGEGRYEAGELDYLPLIDFPNVSSSI